MHLFNFDEIKNLKNSDAVIEKIENIKSFITGNNCILIKEYDEHIISDDKKITFNIRISIPLS